jgi:hypothetical protein
VQPQQDEREQQQRGLALQEPQQRAQEQQEAKERRQLPPGPLMMIARCSRPGEQ